MIIEILLSIITESIISNLLDETTFADKDSHW